MPSNRFKSKHTLKRERREAREALQIEHSSNLAAERRDLEVRFYHVSEKLEALGIDPDELMEYLRAIEKLRYA